MGFLELHGVMKKFGRTTVVDSFDLDVSQGELISLLGGSGCGKTTTLRMIAGFETPSSGSICIGTSTWWLFRRTGAPSEWSSSTMPCSPT